jgi:hypothetical protein
MRRTFMKFTIDRFEGDFAVVELDNGDMMDVPKCFIPKGAKAGDVIKVEVDKEGTKERKKKIEELAKDLWE